MFNFSTLKDRFSSVLIMSFCLPLSLSAQVDTSVASADTLPIVEREIEEILVTAPLAQIADNHTEMKSEELNFPNAGQNLPYLLTTTPSLTVMSDDGLGVGYTYFRVRGTDHARINMTVNNVPLNDSESQTVFWVNMTDMSSSMTSLNVQRGVTSTNGSAAFGASVNMTTLDNTLDKTNSLELSFNGGMYNTFRELVSARVWLTDHWRLEGRFSKVNSDGYLYRAKSDLYSYHAALGYYAPKTKLTLSVFGGKEKTYMAWNGVYREQIEEDRRYNPAGEYIDDVGQIAYYPNQNDNYQQQHAQLHLNQKLIDGLYLDATLFYTHGNGYYEEYKANKKFEDFGLLNYVTKVDGTDVTIKRSDFVREKHMNNHYYGGTFFFRWLTEHTDAQAGASLANYNGDHWGNITYLRDSLYPHPLPYNYEFYRSKGKKLDGNIYAKVNWHIIDKNQERLTLYGDLQYRFVHYQIKGINAEDLRELTINEHFNFFNPKAGLTYSNHGHQTYFSFAVANREPVRSNYTESGTDEMPNPERLYDYELGYTYSHKRFVVGANLYFMDYKNQLVPSGRLTSTGATLTRNVDKSYRMGIELTGGVKIVDNKKVGKHTCDFRWDANLTLSRNKIVDFVDWFWYDDYSDQKEVSFGTTDICFSPAVTFGSLFTLDIAGVTATIQTNVVDKQYLDNTMSKEAMLKAYTYTNLNVQYLLPLPKKWPDIALRLQINNLFNSKYEANGWSYAEIDSATGDFIYMPAFYPQATINVHGGFSIVF